MLELEKIKLSGYFEEITLYEWDILFLEWATDDYLYIIYDGELIVEKSIKTVKNSFKVLWHLWVWNIIGEGALLDNRPKEVQIRANRTTILLRIEAKNKFKKFLMQFPDVWYGVIISIIYLTNSRLLRSNKEITANYEVNIAISKIKDFSIFSIYKLLLIFESILWVDQIIYFEKNIVMNDYYKLKYDSRNKKSLQDIILKFTDDTFDKKVLENEWIQLTKFSRYTKLTLWEINYWFLLIGNEKKDFSENEEKLLQNTAWSFVWIIHQKKLIDDQKNKNYMRNA